MIYLNYTLIIIGLYILFRIYIKFMERKEVESEKILREYTHHLLRLSDAKWQYGSITKAEIAHGCIETEKKGEDKID